MRLFHKHTWEPVAASPFGIDLHIVMRCKACGNFTQKKLDGAYRCADEINALIRTVNSEDIEKEIQLLTNSSN